MGAWRTDRGHFRAALTRYDQARTRYGLPAIKHQGVFARHKILTSIASFFVFLSLVAQCGGEPATTAAPAPLVQTTVAAPAPAAPATAPPTESSAPPLDPAAKKLADDKRKAKEKKQAEATAKKKAAATRKAAAAAKKKAAAAANQKAAAAKQKAAARRKAAAKKKAAQRAAAKEAAQERADERDTFDNCPDMKRTYPHGVGRTGAHDHTSGSPPVTTFRRSTRIYELNSDSDRDGDGVACEQR